MQTTTAIAVAIAPVALALIKWAYRPTGLRLRSFLGRRLPEGRIKRALLKPVD